LSSETGRDTDTGTDKHTHTPEKHLGAIIEALGGIRNAIVFALYFQRQTRVADQPAPVS
jgi:hypothetical protein